MARTFKPVSGGRVRANLAYEELELLRNLPDELRTVLDAGAADTANERLFPPAYLQPEDADAADEYRRLMHEELLANKRAAGELLTESLGRASRHGSRWQVDLSEEEAMAWLGVLNDIRLTLGVRLEIKEDLDGEIDESDPRAPGLRLLYYLGWLEENLLEALPR
jgi:hypothetical protein